jgi:glycosyltransferase involved in cell wall biosynthesis
VGESNKRDYQLLTQNTIEVIPNGYDIEIATGQPLQELDKEFTITYLGAMNASRNPEVLWKAIQLLIKENSTVLENLKVKLVGSIEPKIFESIEEHGVGKYVSHISYVPYTEALKLQNQAQLLLIVINNTYNKSTIVPGKIYENIASLRPLICIGPKDGDTAKIIDTTASGAVVEYDDVSFMKQTLEKYYQQYLKQALVNEPNENIQKYSRKALTERMSSLLNKITHKP